MPLSSGVMGTSGSSSNSSSTGSAGSSSNRGGSGGSNCGVGGVGSGSSSSRSEAAGRSMQRTALTPRLTGSQHNEPPASPFTLRGTKAVAQLLLLLLLLLMPMLLGALEAGPGRVQGALVPSQAAGVRGQGALVPSQAGRKAGGREQQRSDAVSAAAAQAAVAVAAGSAAEGATAATAATVHPATAATPGPAADGAAAATASPQQAMRLSLPGMHGAAKPFALPQRLSEDPLAQRHLQDPGSNRDGAPASPRGTSRLSSPCYVGTTPGRLNQVSHPITRGDPSEGSGPNPEPQPVSPAQGPPSAVSGEREVQLWGLASAMLALGLSAGGVSYLFRLKLHLHLLLVLARAPLQILALGYLLAPATRHPSWWWLPPVLSAALVALASLEAVSRPRLGYRGMVRHALLAVAGGTAGGLVYCLLVVLPRWRSQQSIIPLTGLLLARVVSGVGAAISALLDEVVGKRDHIELLLSLGASRPEAMAGAVQAALTASLTYLLTEMGAVGLVGVPGAMSGLMFEGVDPVQASRLQLCVLLVSVAAGVLASLLVLLLACRALLNDRHQLTLHTLRHRQHGEGLPSMTWHQARVLLGRAHRLALRLYFSCCRGRPGRGPKRGARGSTGISREEVVGSLYYRLNDRRSASSRERDSYASCASIAEEPLEGISGEESSEEGEEPEALSPAAQVQGRPSSRQSPPPLPPFSWVTSQEAPRDVTPQGVARGESRGAERPEGATTSTPSSSHQAPSAQAGDQSSLRVTSPQTLNPQPSSAQAGDLASLRVTSPKALNPQPSTTGSSAEPPQPPSGWGGLRLSVWGARPQLPASGQGGGNVRAWSAGQGPVPAQGQIGQAQGLRQGLGLGQGQGQVGPAQGAGGSGHVPTGGEAEAAGIRGRNMPLRGAGMGAGPRAGPRAAAAEGLLGGDWAAAGGGSRAPLPAAPDQSPRSVGMSSLGQAGSVMAGGESFASAHSGELLGDCVSPPLGSLGAYARYEESAVEIADAQPENAAGA